MADQSWTRFTGTGTAPNIGAWQNLPVVDPEAPRRPAKYVASADLAAAVNVALTLGMPLLLTGEPGSGKSQLAYRLAWELGFPNPNYQKEEAERQGKSYAEPEFGPMKFVVKSTTEARDLFYTFDTVGRFHAAQVDAARFAAKSKRDTGTPPPIEPDRNVGAPVEAVNFIDYQALGLAILRAKGMGNLQRLTVSRKQAFLAARHGEKIAPEPVRSVVLIDEIDKAPRDVPNDILAEIEDMSFVIPELGRVEIGLDHDDQRFRPVIIITSNSERDLPPAFLRRCVYYHVPFPPFEEDKTDPQGTSVLQIARSRLGDRYTDDALREPLALFRHLRNKERELAGKPPSIAELLSWLEQLHHDHFAAGARAPAGRLSEIPEALLVRSVQQVLLKSKDDQLQAKQLMRDWDNNRA